MSHNNMRGPWTDQILESKFVTKLQRPPWSAGGILHARIGEIPGASLANKESMTLLCALKGKSQKILRFNRGVLSNDMGSTNLSPLKRGEIGLKLRIL
jgi:hypothetical protein